MNFIKTNASHHTIYVIEDSSKSRNDFVVSLQQSLEAKVEVFDAPEDTLMMPHPSVIIADSGTMDDLDFIDCLKTCFQAPIIVLSDRPTLGTAVRLMRAGASDFFPKPVSVKALVERIETLLAASPLPQNTQAKTQQNIPHNKLDIVPFADQERAIIENALGVYDGNITQAAAALQISPSTIYRKKQGWAPSQ